MMAKTYEVVLQPSNLSGARNNAWRAGRQFTVLEPQILELTDEEVEAFENDWRFKITVSGKKAKSSKVSASETVLSAEIEAGEEAAEVKAETLEDTAVVETETVTGETPSDVEILLKDYSRGELDAQARELGVENPEGLANKTEVAEAIVSAR